MGNDRFPIALGLMDSPEDRRKLVFLALALAVLAAVIAVIAIPRGTGEEPIARTSLAKPGEVLAQGEPATVDFVTTEGDFTIQLDTDRAPVTANNFAYLTEEGFYDGLTFHRIVPGFVIQGGDPAGDGTGGPGYSVAEKPPADLEYEPGIVAMAKSGTEPSGTSGSQFFIVTGPNGASLTPDYALVGRVSEGFDVVQKIGELGGADESPTREVVIERATLQRG